MSSVRCVVLFTPHHATADKAANADMVLLVGGADEIGSVLLRCFPSWCFLRSASIRSVSIGYIIGMDLENRLTYSNRHPTDGWRGWTRGLAMDVSSDQVPVF